MSSIRRINSSRANGRRSRGPVTASGKLISSQNARRHGLLARCIVLDNESPVGFAEIHAEHLDRFRPADGVEAAIIEEMVAASWRLRRAWSIETQTLNDCFDVPNPGDGTKLLAAAYKSTLDSNGLALLQRYETRLHCIYQRGLRNLRELQNTPVPKEPSPISEQLIAASGTGDRLVSPVVLPPVVLPPVILPPVAAVPIPDPVPPALAPAPAVT